MYARIRFSYNYVTGAVSTEYASLFVDSVGQHCTYEELLLGLALYGKARVWMRRTHYFHQSLITSLA